MTPTGLVDWVAAVTISVLFLLMIGTLVGLMISLALGARREKRNPPEPKRPAGPGAATCSCNNSR